MCFDTRPGLLTRFASGPGLIFSQTRIRSSECVTGFFTGCGQPPYTRCRDAAPPKEAYPSSPARVNDAFPKGSVHSGVSVELSGSLDARVAYGLL
jgi:hypothetical protein